MSRATRILRPTVALAALCTMSATLLAACGGDDKDSSDVAADAPSSQEASPTPSPVVLPAGVLALPEPNAEDETVITEPGRYRVALSDTLAFEADLPVDTSVNGDGLYIIYKDTVLKVEPAGERYGVPSDPCNGFEAIAAAGPTVEDLVTAIRAQSIYRTSRPEPVEVDGAAGTYLEVRIPAKYDASACADDQVGLPGNPDSNNNMAPGYVGRWWVLDVDGQRTVAQAFCGPCDGGGLETMTGVVQGITFTPTP
jgi:hypothetical protein